MRSASSLALRSASSKSIGSPPPPPPPAPPAPSFRAPSFVAPPRLAPSTAPPLRAPVVLVEPPALVRRAEDVVVREGAGAAAAFRGDLDRPVASPSEPLPPGVSGEAAALRPLPTTGGVAVRDGGGVGRLMAGLSQDAKKSSSALSAVAAATASSAASTTTSFGYLPRVSRRLALCGWWGRTPWHRRQRAA